MQRPASEALDLILYEDVILPGKVTLLRQVAIAPGDYMNLRRDAAEGLLWEWESKENKSEYRGKPLIVDNKIRPGWVVLRWADGTTTERKIREAADAGENG
jgi:hypothetical protein